MHFDILIVVTPADCERVLPLYPRLVNNFENGNICFIGTDKVGELAKASAIAKRAEWVDENSIVSYDDVHACMSKKLEPILEGKPLPRGVTGWYYQQFLKMQYSFICKDEYYMVWDGDTIPCKKIQMFASEEGRPYLDLKHEYHPVYFETMGKLLPGLSKVIERSFISEHMLFKTELMKALIADIESNDAIPGTRFWEKIINCIEPEKIYDSAFSEFETYGTYVVTRYPDVYELREWHSFRLGGSFFDMNTICDRDFKWLAVDFDAISFEKDQSTQNGTGGYFDNPKVQKKISAKKLLQEVQVAFTDAYKEVWDDDLSAAEANYREGGYYKVKEKTELNVPDDLNKEGVTDPGEDYVFDPDRQVTIPGEWVNIFFDSEENKRHIILYGVSATELMNRGRQGIKNILSYLEKYENCEEDCIVIVVAPKGLADFMRRCNLEVSSDYEIMIRDISTMEKVVLDDLPDSAELDMFMAVADEYYGDECRLADMCREKKIPVTIQGDD